MDLSDLRHDFGKNSKRQTNWPDNPFLLLKLWIGEAIDAGISEANTLFIHLRRWYQAAQIKAPLLAYRRKFPLKRSTLYM